MSKNIERNTCRSADGVTIVYAVAMKHMGHYPMLERPEEFNRLLAKVIAEL